MQFKIAMPGLVPGIHVFRTERKTRERPGQACKSPAKTPLILG